MLKAIHLCYMILVIFQGKAPLTLNHGLPLLLLKFPLLFKGQSLSAIYHPRLNTISTTTNIRIHPSVWSQCQQQHFEAFYLFIFIIIIIIFLRKLARCWELICVIVSTTSPDKNNKLFYQYLAGPNLYQITDHGSIFPSLLKEQCHEDFAVLGQYCAKTITLSLS